MYFTGFADEAGSDLDLQIKATKSLGWKNIETRMIGSKTLATLTDAEFADVERKLRESGVAFNCYGSAVANWAKPITESPESSYEEMRCALPRMQKLGIKMMRIMSFAVPEEFRADAWQFEEEVVKRLQIIVKMAEDAGVVCVHENCMNFGGLSKDHTLRLCERINSPSFKLVFDTGNPVFNVDYSPAHAGREKQMQNALEFFRAVKEFVAYIHIKDAVYRVDKPVYCFGGEGDGCVKEILTELFRGGYDGGISIEPHMCHVFHDQNPGDQAKTAHLSYENYIEYGTKLEALVKQIRAQVAGK